MKKKAQSYGIKPEGSSHLHIELATIFLLHSIEKYLSNEAVYGCIAPETILNGHHHNRFRRSDYLTAEQPVSFSIDELWRIKEGVFKNEAIVLFGKKTNTPQNLNPIPCVYLDEDNKRSENIYRHQQGNRTAWSTKPSRNSLEDLAVYTTGQAFRQGADIMPRTLLFYEVNKTNSRRSLIQSIDRVRSPIAFTIKDAKKHKNFKLTPRPFPNEFIFEVITSNLLTSFHLATPQNVILPIKKSIDYVWQLVSPTRIATKGAIVQNIFNQIAGEIATNGTVETIFKLVDTRGKLHQQIIKSERYIIITGAGGGKVCCAYISTDNFDVNKLILDQTVYWAQVETEDEALYLCGLLNSEAVSELIADFQPKGAFGKRHIHKLPFGVTPPYNIENPAHQEVVNKTRTLILEYQDLANNNTDLSQFLNPNNGTLSRRRRKILGFLKSISSYEDYEDACRGVYGI